MRSMRRPLSCVYNEGKENIMRYLACLCDELLVFSFRESSAYITRFFIYKCTKKYNLDLHLYKCFRDMRTACVLCIQNRFGTFYIAASKVVSGQCNTREDTTSKCNIF